MRGEGIRLWTLALACLLIAQTVAAQSSPYAGLEARRVKALSPEAVGSYLEGEGMGMALAAELNGYPGPKHVLELVTELSLTEEQRAAADAIFQAMHSAAVDLGEKIVAAEEALDAMFADEAISSDQLAEALKQLATLQGKLRFAHLDAHLSMKQVLTRDQTARYVEIRGYSEEHQGHHRN